MEVEGVEVEGGGIWEWRSEGTKRDSKEMNWKHV